MLHAACVMADGDRIPGDSRCASFLNHDPSAIPRSPRADSLSGEKHEAVAVDPAPEAEVGPAGPAGDHRLERTFAIGEQGVAPFIYFRF